MIRALGSRGERSVEVGGTGQHHHSVDDVVR